MTDDRADRWLWNAEGSSVSKSVLNSEEVSGSLEQIRSMDEAMDVDSTTAPSKDWRPVACRSIHSMEDEPTRPASEMRSPLSVSKRGSTNNLPTRSQYRTREWPDGDRTIFSRAVLHHTSPVQTSMPTCQYGRASVSPQIHDSVGGFSLSVSDYTLQTPWERQSTPTSVL